MLNCYYALGGINYKNGVITTCPRQANQLVFANETILPSEIYNHKNFRLLRNKLHAENGHQDVIHAKKWRRLVQNL